ncbi:SurA N-terminal domain-containing protein [Patescibacteria group bacterium]|nr:SurA N-terminal domain-containing protein [Patescibacteria group bacterium]
MQQKILIGVGVVVLVAALGGLYWFSTRESPVKYGDNTELFNTTAGAGDNTQQAAAEIELPDVVARVNGQDIKKEDLLGYEAQIAAGQGFEVTALNAEGRAQLQAQALDALISNALIKQAAANSGITATDEEVNAQLEVVKGQFEDLAKYQEALTNQGMTEDDFRLLVASDLGIQGYLEQTLGLKAVDATEDEINAVYAQEAAANSSTAPLAELHDQIKTFVIQQKQQQQIIAHIQELRSKGNVEVLVQ